MLQIGKMKRSSPLKKLIPHFRSRIGTVVDYTNFKQGEPNDDNENCIEVYSNNEWNDEDCSDELDFICQFDADAPYEFDEGLSKY